MHRSQPLPTSLLFLLGNTPRLSLAEVRATIDPQAELINAQVAQAKTNQSAQTLIDRLGGTIKIFQPIDRLNVTTETKTLTDYLTQKLAQIAQQQTTKLSFYIAQIGQEHRERIDLNRIKQNLKTLNLKARFSPGKRNGLSAANLLHQKTVELNLIYTDESIILAKTVAVQNIDLWTVRDRYRPYTQRQKGMLPLKVARMMVNLAIRQDELQKKSLLDPFSGSAGVLMEAATVGVKNLMAADNDQQAVKGSRLNLNWLREKFHLPIEYEVYHQDATQLQLTKKIDYLVTEPFLGRQTPNPKKIENIALGLEKLYWGSFRHWTNLLQPDARVVIIFPYWPMQPKANFKKLIDKLAKIGYTTSSEPLSYAREGAQVVRRIWQFEFRS